MTNSPDESLPKGVERFVGSSGLISPLKRGLRVHLWFASPFSGTRTVAMSAPPLSVWKKWQVDWCHLCFFPSYSSCLCLSNVLHTHNYEQYDTTPLTQQFLKLKNPMMNQTKKKLNLFHQLLLKLNVSITPFIPDYGTRHAKIPAHVLCCQHAELQPSVAQRPRSIICHTWCNQVWQWAELCNTSRVKVRG